MSRTRRCLPAPEPIRRPRPRPFRRAEGAGAIALIALLAVRILAPAEAVAAPVVVSTDPTNQQIGVPLDADLRVRFAGALDASSVNEGNVLLTGSYRGTLGATVSWAAATREIVVDPVEDFLPGERIRLTVGEGIRDRLGAPLDGGHTIEVSAWTAALPDGQFTTAPGSWSIGSIAFNLTVGDLDADGLPEAIFSNVVPDSLTLLTPDGLGGWSLMAQLPTDILPRHVALGDVDADGFSDLVYVVGTDRIEIYFNQGGGAFSGPVDYATGQTPYGVFLADLDADGDLDVATANFNSHDLSVLKNRGDGTFDPHVDWSAGPLADSPRWVDGADFDGDGDIDLACCNGYSFDVSVLLNGGNGGFATQSASVGVGDSPNFLEARDFDGDAIVDIVTVNAGPGSLSFLKGNGDGTFQPAVDHLVESTLPYGIQVADLEGDGDLDVVIPLRGANGWRAMRNDGSGAFTPGPLHTGGNHCHTVGVADWDGDGDLDVVSGFAISRDMFHYVQSAPPAVTGTLPGPNATGVPVGAPLEVWFDTDLSPGSLTGDGFRVEGAQSGLHAMAIEWDGSTQRVTLTPTSPFAPGEIVAVTVTGDGVVSSETGLPHEGFTFEFLTEGAASFASFAGGSLALPGSDPVDLVAADLDEDGVSDLVVASFLSDEVTVLLTGGPGLMRVAGSYPTEVGPLSVFAGDLDSDGHVDLVAGNLISGSVSILNGDGTGGFSAQPPVPLSGSPFAIAGADFDVDGDLDLAVAEIDPDCVRILWNDGLGAFPTSAVLAVSGGPLDLAVADLDRDGDLDLVSVDSGNNRVEIFLCGEGGLFESAGTFGTGNTPVSVFVWDTNGDGWVDLVSADYGNGGISVLESTGAGASFAPAFNLPSDDLPHGIWAADLTGDDELDLVTANSGAAAVSVFRNLGGGVFDEPTTLSAGMTPYAVVGGDWNDDGLVDLAAVNRTSGDLTLLLNGVTTGAEAPTEVRISTGILGVRPNPSSDRALFRFALARPGVVDLRVFDVHGRTVRTVRRDRFEAGVHDVAWDGRDHRGQHVAAGVYFLRMEAEDQAWARKILRVR